MPQGAAIFPLSGSAFPGVRPGKLLSAGSSKWQQKKDAPANHAQQREIGAHGVPKPGSRRRNPAGTIRAAENSLIIA